jgi:hypothetical protein
VNVLFEAIYNKFDADAALKAAVTDLYNTTAPQDTDFPYLVMLLVTSSHEWTFNTDLEDANIQFSIYSNESSPEEAGDIFELLKTCFDDAILTITGWDNFFMVRQSPSNLIRTPDDVWHYIVNYRVRIQKQ